MNRNFAAIAAALMLVGPILEKMAIARPAGRTEQLNPFLPLGDSQSVGRKALILCQGLGCLFEGMKPFWGNVG